MFRTLWFAVFFLTDTEIYSTLFPYLSIKKVFSEPVLLCIGGRKKSCFISRRARFPLFTSSFMLYPLIHLQYVHRYYPLRFIFAVKMGLINEGYTLLESFKLFSRKEMKSGLQGIYSSVSTGVCAECTACCSESVNTFYTEYLHILQLLVQERLLPEYVQKILTYYFTELVIPQKCPLLQENGYCVVYEARPLPCRIFGHLSQEEYEVNYKETLEANKEAVSYLAEKYDIIVPESVYLHKVPHCKRFVSNRGMSLDERDDLIDELFMLDSQFLSKGLLSPDRFNLSMVQWFAYDIFGAEEAQEMRLSISKEISDTGKSESLHTLLQSEQIGQWCERIKGDVSASL